MAIWGLVVSLLVTQGVNAVRPYCGGSSCSVTLDCRQPDGNGGFNTGACCGGTCTLTPTPVARGGSCNVSDLCKQCTAGLSCTDAQGNPPASGSLGTCNQFLKQWTPGCHCDNSSQCLGSSICGSSSSVCLATGLYSDSSCQFGVQCLSGYCSGGKCHGRNLNVPSSCTSDSQCPIGTRCSNWGVPGTKQCHELSGNGGFCYDDSDCKDNYYTNYPPQECISGGTGTGRCTTLSAVGEVCGTASTPSCGYYTVNVNGFSYQAQLQCNYSMTPYRCVQPVATTYLPLGSSCDTQHTTGYCVSGAYCETVTKQPPIGNTQGTCVAIGNVPLGGNCSSSSGCSPNLCQYNSSFTYYICQPAINNLGAACNHSDTKTDNAQCPNTAYQLTCACNNTCAPMPPSSTVTTSCPAATLNYASMLPTNLPISPASFPAQQFKGIQTWVASKICCTECPSSTYRAIMASTTGVTVDCGSLTINQENICDNNYQNKYYLQNCDQYSAGTMATFSFVTLVLSFVAVLTVQ